MFKKKAKSAAFSPCTFKVFQEFLQLLGTLNLTLLVNTWWKLHILFLLVTIMFRFRWKFSLEIFENCLKTSSEEFLFSEFPSLRPKVLLNITLTQGFFSASLQNINYKLTAILNRVEFVSTDMNFYWSTHSFTVFINNIFVDGQNDYMLPPGWELIHALYDIFIASHEKNQCSSTNRLVVDNGCVSTMVYAFALEHSQKFTSWNHLKSQKGRFWRQ